MIEIDKLQRIAKEEHWGVVARQIPIALFGVEFQREAANIPLSISCAPLAGNSWKAGQHVSFFTNFRKYFCFGVSCYIVCDSKGAKGAWTLGVHAALRDDFPVEVSHLFQEPYILERDGSPFACGDRILVVTDGCPGGGCYFRVYACGLISAGNGVSQAVFCHRALASPFFAISLIHVKSSCWVFSCYSVVCF